MFLSRKTPFEKGAVQNLSHAISSRSSFLTTRLLDSYPARPDSPHDGRMAFTRADLQAFYRMGFRRGYATWYADPTDDEINEFFKGAYKAWCEEGEKDRPKRKKLESKLNYLENAQPLPLPECEEFLNRQREYTRKALQKMAGGGRVKP